MTDTINTTEEVIAIEEEFHISKYIIVYKFILGAIEAILGVGILVYGNKILALYQQYRTRELLEDPRDLFVNITDKVVPYLSKNIRLVVLILIVLGIIKIVGSIALLKKKHWGLDLLVGLTFIILPFQTVDLLLHPAVSKIIFLILDALIAFYLVQFEPRKYFSKMFVRMKIKKHK